MSFQCFWIVPDNSSINRISILFYRSLFGHFFISRSTVSHLIYQQETFVDVILIADSQSNLWSFINRFKFPLITWPFFAGLLFPSAEQSPITEASHQHTHTNMRTFFFLFFVSPHLLTESNRQTSSQTTNRLERKCTKIEIRGFTQGQRRNRTRGHEEQIIGSGEWPKELVRTGRLRRS